MASRAAANRPEPPKRPAAAIDDYDIDDDPFAESGDEAARNKTDSKKRKDASSLGIDEAVSVAKKARVPRVKLDETRLLSENGIPKLRTKARSLKFKGKGHEFSDTAKLLSFYQLWLDDLFPKAKFLDALSMVEKAGHKKFLHLKRIEWINEGEPRSSAADFDDVFGDSNQPEERDPAIFPANLAPVFRKGTTEERAKTPEGDVPLDDEDIYDATPHQPKTQRPTTTSVFQNRAASPDGDEPDEDDLDALMAEEEAQRTAPTSIFGNGKPSAARSDSFGEEDDLDAFMAEAEAATSSKPAKAVLPRKNIVEDDDDDEDDLDALMAEAEAGARTSTTRDLPTRTASDANHTKLADVPSQGADEDEEAAMAEMDGLW
ncbi:Swi3-domain-containing protein [Xylariaceae sp. FL0255]|nr:Swi3-domain-containing protein [Xylariaceae sp. FL0255]